MGKGKERKIDALYGRGIVDTEHPVPSGEMGMHLPQRLPDA